jgi:iron complex outermembrane receptor protein
MNTSTTRRGDRAAPARAAGTLTAVAAAVLTLAGPDGAFAQDATQTITVTGIRRAIENAISVKKNADQIVEAISAEDIGKLPDTSIAESISRLPGVAVQTTKGRAQAISIRGMAPDFATALLNGREQVSTGDSRFVEFDQYPSELLNAVVVYKSPDAALIGQGLAGTVDLQVVRPLDFPSRAVAVNLRKVKLGKGLKETGDGERFSISYIDQFADRTLGVALGFARLDETGGRSTRFESWGVADTNFGAGTVKTPGGFNSWLDQETRKRDGAVAVLQYKPNKDFTSVVDLFYSKFDKDESKKGFQAPVGFSSAGGYDPGGTLTTANVVNGVATSGTFDNFKGVVRNDTEANKDTLLSVGWNNQLKFGEWTGTLDLNHSKIKRDGGIIETTAGLPGNGNFGGAVDTISWTNFDGSNVQGAAYTTGLNYGDRNAVQLTDVQGWGGNIGADGRSTTPQAGYSKLPHIEDKINALRLSGKRDLADAWVFTRADFGVNYVDREKNRRLDEGRLLVSTTDAWAGVPVPSGGTLSPSGIPIVVWDPRGSVGSIYTQDTKLVGDINNKTWSVDEKISTFYGKLDLETKLWGLEVTGNAGVQLVHTRQSSDAFGVDGQPCPGDVCPTFSVSGGTSYNDVLPSLNLAFELGDDARVRFALARVMARPILNDLRASLGFGVDQQLGVLKGSTGNPELKPWRANAIDLAYEQYFSGSKGYWGVAAFYKQLRNYIVKQNTAVDFTPFLSPGTPLPPSGAVLGLLELPQNGSGGYIKGLEFSLSYPFGLAIKEMDGFGIQASYSATDSSVRLPTAGITGDAINTPNIPLPGLSKNVSNVTLYFERAGFGVRLAQRTRSRYIGEITNIFGDRNLTYIKSERVVDAQVSYEIQSGPAKGLSFLVQGSNLNNSPFIRYRDTPSNQIENKRFGSTYLFGLNYKLQ